MVVVTGLHGVVTAVGHQNRRYTTEIHCCLQLSPPLESVTRAVVGFSRVAGQVAVIACRVKSLLLWLLLLLRFRRKKEFVALVLLRVRFQMSDRYRMLRVKVRIGP
ncbi:hypothetical protein PIB30_064271 [Stylosanthes scabra]|uniref:Uncharacterized protein n=1 Tax=Stylosanthes scabra TaxID=79078 RepID=A0ABU6QMS1_9FABA|nr:hypothetical protein [Stylosanthes scabra]